MCITVIYLIIINITTTTITIIIIIMTLATILTLAIICVKSVGTEKLNANGLLLQTLQIHFECCDICSLPN